MLENVDREFRKKKLLLNKIINTFQMIKIVYSIAGYSTRKHLILDSDTRASSETQAQSVGSEKKTGQKFSSKGGSASGYRLSPNYFQKFKRIPLLIGHKKRFVLLYPIGEQFLLSSFREFVHDCYCLATLARFVPQACAFRGNFYFLLS